MSQIYLICYTSKTVKSQNGVEMPKVDVIGFDDYDNAKKLQQEINDFGTIYGQTYNNGLYIHAEIQIDH